MLCHENQRLHRGLPLSGIVFGFGQFSDVERCGCGMSAPGTFRTWRDVRLESAMRPKANVDLHPGQAAYEKTPSALDGV